MRLVTPVAAASLLLSIEPSAAAAKPAPPASSSHCQRYVGQPVKTISFDELKALVPHAAPQRGEYETSAEFAARAAKQVPVFSEPLIVRQRQDHLLIIYDADAQILKITAFAFGDTPMVAGEVFNYIDPTTGRRLEGSELGFVVRDEQTGTRTYEATNGHGAKVTVDQTLHDFDIVWEGQTKLEESRFAGNEYQQNLADIPMSAEQARIIKTESSTALVLVPRQPYFSQADYASEATFTSPHSTAWHTTVIGADVQCGLILDKASQVLFAFDVK